MPSAGPFRIALVWAQFAPYHIDRCEAAGRRFAGRAEVLAVELASRSQTYAWPQSGAAEGCRKITLFPDADAETIAFLPRLAALVRAVWHCRIVCLGIGYDDPAIIVLAWVLRALGKTVVMMSDSKFDDKDRRSGFELFKQVLLLPYSAAIVAGRRQIDYARFLGFVRRPVLLGYDTVATERIARAAAAGSQDRGSRPFVYVGRFVAKKNLSLLIEGYALYAAEAGANCRALSLVGDGPLEADLRQLAADRGLSDKVEFAGFQNGDEVAARLGGALALVLPSRVEQWGLVVNEAIAAGIPVILSNPVGARDLLLRNMVNGFTFSPSCPQALARAMQLLAGDAERRRDMGARSRDRAWMADAERFADAVELLADPAAEPAGATMRALFAALD